jgi:hypothetical protein
MISGLTRKSVDWLSVFYEQALPENHSPGTIVSYHSILMIIIPSLCGSLIIVGIPFCKGGDGFKQTDAKK